MALALALLVVAGAVVYWRLYLLGPRGPVHPRPYLVRVGADSAELRWRTSPTREVRVTALAEDGREVTAPRRRG